MSAGQWVAVGCLGVLAVGHSVLGEVRVLGWLRVDGPPGRRAVVRVAWHLTSLSWLGLAAAYLLAPGSALAVGLTLALSGGLTLVATRGAHFAWAVFFTGALGVASTLAAGAGRGLVAVTGAGVAFALAALHVAWAAGLRWGLEAALPQRNGQPTLRPGRAVTLVVAFALGGLGLVFLSLGGLAALSGAPTLAALAALVFAARVVGDFRTVGLFKQPGADVFSRQDTRWYTPLCFALSAALLWVR